jgi:hypothetical protein
MSESGSSDVEVVENSSVHHHGHSGPARKQGRPEKPVWIHFEKGDRCNSTKRFRGTCIHCNATFDGRPEVLEDHILLKCPRIPPDVRKDFDKTYQACIPEGVATTSLSRADAKRLAKSKQARARNQDVTQYMWTTR